MSTIQIFGRDSETGAVTPVKIDSAVGGVIVTDHVHHEVHEGEMFVASYTVAHGSEIANDASQSFLFVTGTKESHLFFEVSIGGNSEVLFYEGATTSNDGTGLTVINMKRTSSETAVEEVYHTPTVTGNGTTLIHSFATGGSGPLASGGAERVGTEWILKKSTKYLLTVTNRSGNAIQLSAVFEWYSE